LLVGSVEQNPILQRPVRNRRWHRHPEAGITPAEAPKDGHREDLSWLPPASYRRWRDGQPIPLHRDPQSPRRGSPSTPQEPRFIGLQTHTGVVPRFRRIQWKAL
jgi:hypothetical protein